MFPDILEDGGKISLLDKSLAEGCNEGHLTIFRGDCWFNQRSSSRFNPVGRLWLIWPPGISWLGELSLGEFSF